MILIVRPTSWFALQYSPPSTISTLSLHDALPIFSPLDSQNTAGELRRQAKDSPARASHGFRSVFCLAAKRSEEHTSELQSRFDIVCRLLLEKKKEPIDQPTSKKL